MAPVGRNARNGIVVAGSVAFDTVGTVERLPDRDTTARVTSLDVVHGGAAGNVAAALAKLGAASPVRLLGAVGPDFAGSGYERDLVALGVDLSTVARVADRTAHALLFTDPQGSQQVYFYPGASADLRVLRPAPAAVGHFAAGDFRAYPSLMRECDLVTLDPGQETFHRPLAELEACFPHVHYLFLNRHELAFIGDEGGWTLARLFSLGVRAVVESRGVDGSRVHTPDGRHVDAPVVPAKMVDPTGAGDSHRAGFIAALLRGADLATAARFGGAVASFVIETLGPQRGLPTLKDAESRYQSTFGRPPF